MYGAKRTGRVRRWLGFTGRLASVLILTGLLVLSDDHRAAIARALADPMAILQGRSPGFRDSAELRQTKPEMRISPISEDATDFDFAISPEAFEPPADAFTEGSESPLVPSPTEPSPPGPPVADVPTPVLAMHRGPLGGGGGFFGGVSGSPGGGKDGDGGGDGCIDISCGISTGGPEMPQDPIPVPEPATWLLAICGFMALGGTLRLVRWFTRLSMRRRPAT